MYQLLKPRCHLLIKFLPTVLGLRRLSFPSDSALCIGIKRTLLGGLRLTPYRVTLALEPGAFLHENFHLGSSADTDNTQSAALHFCPHLPTVTSAPGSQTEEKAEAHQELTLHSPQGPSSRLTGDESRFWSLSPDRQLVTGIYGSSGIQTTPMVCRFRKCFQAGSGTHTQWDTPPGSETTPSCGWCGHRAHRSGRNWMIPAQPHGRWHTET